MTMCRPSRRTASSSLAAKQSAHSPCRTASFSRCAVASLAPSLPRVEMTDEMFARAVFKNAGRPRSASPKQMISLRLPPEVIARWKATGPGWQTRMAKRLEKTPLPRAESEA